MNTATQTDYLSPEEGHLLLRIARESLNQFVLSSIRLELDAFDLTARLREKHGAFVTLTKGGQLRGCIGYTKSPVSLAEAVRDNAINAAVRDPRFPPVTVSELAGISLEVSALCPGEVPGSPFIPVRDIEEIIVGRDGLYLENAGARGGGLLLPRVAVEQGWDRDQFLSAVCRKAGAPDRAWESVDVTLYRFSAQAFSESAHADGA